MSEHEYVERSEWELGDQAGCKCGWFGNGYYDGSDFAWEEYQKHLAGEKILVNCAETDYRSVWQ
jgi:hypothetical protein